MNKQVKSLVYAIEKFEWQQISSDELEEVTGKVISSDDYESMNLDFREKVELLDMWEVNDLTIKDLSSAKLFFIDWLRGS